MKGLTRDHRCFVFRVFTTDYMPTSSKHLPQQSQLWLAGVCGVMGQLGGVAGGGGGRRGASVLDHQPVPHLLDGCLICDDRDQLKVEQKAKPFLNIFL